MANKEPLYWNSKGKYQMLSDKLRKLIPIEGEVPNPQDNKALELFRKASNCYYDLFNNGLGNKAKEFRQVFGMAGTKLLKKNDYEALDAKMDEIILNASIEQGLVYKIVQDNEKNAVSNKCDN